MYCTSFLPLFQNSASITAPLSSKMHPRFHIYSFALLCILCLSTLSLGDAKSLRGFSIDLIDPDSPLSPSDNNSVCISNTFEFDLSATEFTYLMTIKVDSTIEGKGITTKAIPDTGSDLIWLNGCTGKVCDEQQAPCVKKPHTPPYPGDKCPTECKQLESGCSESLKGDCSCKYERHYADGTTTSGELTNGDIFLHGKDGSEKAERIWFGVSTNTYCKKTEGDEKLVDNDKCMDIDSAGIVGLGHGKKPKLSLIRQLVEHCDIDFKFSYCLPPDSKSPGKLIIGNQVKIPDVDSKKSTPLVTHGDCDSRYCVQLAQVSLKGDETLKAKVSDENNIMIIDSGSSFTFLLPKLFDDFIKHVKSVTGEKDPKGIDHYDYDHCFKEEDGEKLKKVSFEFAKTTVELKQVNFFDRRTHNNEKYLCLTVVKGDPVKINKNILGSRAQIDFRVAFNMVEKRVSFEAVSFEADGCKQTVESLDFEA